MCRLRGKIVFGIIRTGVGGVRLCWNRWAIENKSGTSSGDDGLRDWCCFAFPYYWARLRALGCCSAPVCASGHFRECLLVLCSLSAVFVSGAGASAPLCVAVASVGNQERNPIRTSEICGFGEVSEVGACLLASQSNGIGLRWTTICRSCACRGLSGSRLAVIVNVLSCFATFLCACVCFLIHLP